MAGEAWWEKAAEYEALARDGDDVRFDFRFIPDSEIATFFAAADVVLAPYRIEAQSGVALTAFHFARPVIATTRRRIAGDHRRQQRHPHPARGSVRAGERGRRILHHARPRRDGTRRRGLGATLLLAGIRCCVRGLSGPAMKLNPSRIKVGLELTSKCNLRCGMCPLPVLRRPYEDMEWPMVEKAEREIHGAGLKLKWLHEMGEPLLYARIDDAIRLFPEASLSTNGLVLTEEIGAKLLASPLKRIRICVDSDQSRGLSAAADRRRFRQARRAHARRSSNRPKVIRSASRSRRCARG